jgi:hypothetical protein
MKQIPKWCCNCKFWWTEGKELLGHCADKEAKMGEGVVGIRTYANDGKDCVQFVWVDLRMRRMDLMEGMLEDVAFDEKGKTK